MLLTFWQKTIVPFWGILVSKINVLPFSGGANGAIGGRRHVPFWGILVSKINVLPFSGHETDDFGPNRPKTA
jgi:hypothetical protein